MIQYGEAPFLECSTKGDKRFSPFCARIEAMKAQTIENLYQGAKIFEDGTTGLSWREAKGRKAVNTDELKTLYTRLWDLYFEENPHLIDVIVNASGISDIFGQKGHVCQATEIWRIRERELALRA